VAEVGVSLGADVWLRAKHGMQNEMWNRTKNGIKHGMEHGTDENVVISQSKG